MAPASIDASDLFGVKGLIAVVTGGGSGKKQGNLHPIQCDVTKKSDLERAAEEIKLKYGYVNVVIANSGVVGPNVLGMPENLSISEFKNWLWNWDPDELNNTFAVNTAGVFYTAVAFLELLDEGNKRSHLKQRSQVIATTSIGAYVRTLVAGFGYEGSKAATTHIMKQFATSLVPYEIRANIIAPGWYPSDITCGLIEKQNEGGWPKDFVPEQRPGDEQDIAGAVLFLVSKAGAYINGNALVTDGGRMGMLPATY
ncbi:short-chain dehydrogenase/reductase [Seiridium cupressi]